MNRIHIEAMADILAELHIPATPDQIETIVNDYELHREALAEQSTYQHKGHKSECEECKRLKIELKEITSERDIYHNSVMRRRNASRVWLEGEEVKYEK